MASTARTRQTARQRARERRVALDADAKARNDRIESWTAEVFTGAETRGRALEAVAAAEDAMADGLARLTCEGLVAAEIAKLCEMSARDVHRLLRNRRLSRMRELPSTPPVCSDGEAPVSPGFRPADGAVANGASRQPGQGSGR